MRPQDPPMALRDNLGHILRFVASIMETNGGSSLSNETMLQRTKRFL